MITINGVNYPSKLEAAKALVANGSTVAQAAKETGISYQSVFANTKGLEKTLKRKLKYKIISMGKTGKKSPSDIAKRTGATVPLVVSILKKANITIATKEILNQNQPKPAKKETKPKESIPKKVAKIVKDTIPPTVTIEDDFEDTIEQIPMDPEAELAAKMDMLNK